MAREITTPTYASREIPLIRKTTAETSTEKERMASKLASEPEAIREPEFTFSPWAFTYLPRISLTTTATAMITKETVLYSGVSGSMIFFTDSTKEVMPAYSTIPDTIMALRYSIRPYPKGCFLSAGLAASLVPTIVMTEERASDRLLTASRITAIELDASPMAALNPARKMLVTIPIMLVRMITLSRLPSFCSKASLFSSIYKLVLP